MPSDVSVLQPPHHLELHSSANSVGQFGLRLTPSAPLLSVIRKRSFLMTSPAWRAATTSSAPQARIIRQSSAPNISVKTCIVAEKAGGTPPLAGGGVLTWQPHAARPPSKQLHRRMNRCACQSPLLRADGDSWRSGSSAARLPRPGMPDGVLDLYTLRSRTTLLQPSVPQRSPAPAASGGQPPLSAESRRPARPPRSAAALPRAPVPAARDGSIFPFGHFSGTIRLWRNNHDAGGGCAASTVARPAGKASRSLAALLNL